jgi:hypothetical protein
MRSRIAGSANGASHSGVSTTWLTASKYVRPVA